MQNFAQNRPNFMMVIFQEHTRRGGPSAGLHICTKKRGFCVRARRGNERALRGGIGSVLSAPIFAPLRLAAASFSVRRGGLRQKKSPCQRGAEGLLWRLAFGRAVLTLWQGEASIFLNGQADVDGAARA